MQNANALVFEVVTVDGHKWFWTAINDNEKYALNELFSNPYANMERRGTPYDDWWVNVSNVLSVRRYSA